MENIYTLSDAMIFQRIGEAIKHTRLRQNITQQNLAETSDVSLSTIKKIEDGKIGSFDSLIRVIRVLGKLDDIQQLMEYELVSPSEYYNRQSSARKKTRQRATGKIRTNFLEDPEW